jgi:prophage antirepressor-like protein
VEITAVRKELDYPVRMVVDRDTFVAVMAELAKTLDYRNVKQSAHQHEAELGADFVALMHRVHAVLAQLSE